MVHILSNGDIVQDDDVRAAQPSSRTNSQEGSKRTRTVQDIDNQDVHYHMPQTGSLFDPLNRRLQAAGVPCWNLGPYPVEPVVSLGFLIALLLLGFKGLILGLLLFFVCKWSQNGSGSLQGLATGMRQFGLRSGQQQNLTRSGSSNRQTRSGRPSGHTWHGSGHRLGSS